MPDDIIIIRQPDNRITISNQPAPVTVTQDVNEVSVATPGPRGPQGIQGPPGVPGGTIYVHTEGSASSTWVVNHNLGVKPDVTVIVDDEEVFPDVVHNSDNQCSLVFSTPRAGEARLRP